MANPVPEKRGIFDTIFSFRKKKEEGEPENTLWGPIKLTPEGLKKEKVRLLTLLTDLNNKYDAASAAYYANAKKMAESSAILAGEAKVPVLPVQQPPLGTGPMKAPQYPTTYANQPTYAQTYPYQNTLAQNTVQNNLTAAQTYPQTYPTTVQNTQNPTLLTQNNAQNNLAQNNPQNYPYTTLTSTGTTNPTTNYQGYTRNVGGRHKNKKSRRRRRYGYSRRSSRT
jgi:hypothetical protein